MYLQRRGFSGSEKCSLEFFSFHDTRRTCAKLCRAAGGDLEQIQLLLGHASIQTTERYLETRQNRSEAPNDRLGLTAEGDWHPPCPKGGEVPTQPGIRRHLSPRQRGLIGNCRHRYLPGGQGFTDEVEVVCGEYLLET
ncbi:MAG TPA: site-specific integrase [Armatimonadota bacterium]